MKFRQAGNQCKRVFEVAKLAYANKAKESLLPRSLTHVTFDEFLDVYSTKVNLIFLKYLMAMR